MLGSLLWVGLQLIDLIQSPSRKSKTMQDHFILCKVPSCLLGNVNAVACSGLQVTTCGQVEAVDLKTFISLWWLCICLSICWRLVPAAASACTCAHAFVCVCVCLYMRMRVCVNCYLCTDNDFWWVLSYCLHFNPLENIFTVHKLIGLCIHARWAQARASVCTCACVCMLVHVCERMGYLITVQG